jgi:DNA polymerase-3 subunit beta
VSRDELLEAVRRVKLVARDPVGTPLRMKMSSDGVDLRMMSQDSGEANEHLDGTLKGNEIEMAFNNELLAEGVEACSSENITIDSSEPGRLAVIRGEGDDSFIYLLMPLKS